MPQRRQVQPKLAFIDGMRGVAALYVVLGHMCWMVAARNPYEEWPRWLQAVAAPFWYVQLAVAAFIVLSGFCLQMSLFDRKDGRIHRFGQFFARRARRILPPYYAALGLSIVVALTVTSTQEGLPFSQYVPVTQENVIEHALLIHNWNPDSMYKINGVLWSIGIEAQLYLLFPILILLLFGLGRLPFLLLTFGASLAAVPYVLPAFRIWYLGLFALGMLAAHLAYRPQPLLGTRGGPIALLGLVAFAGCVLTRMQLPSHRLSHVQDIVAGDVLIALAAACWLYAGAVAPWNVAAKVLAYKPLAVVGLFSYSLYLMHHPVQQVLYVYRPEGILGPEAELLYLLSIGLAGILFACLLFFLACERPFLNKRLRRASVRVSTRTELPATAAVAAPTHEEVVVEPPAEPEAKVEAETAGRA